MRGLEALAPRHSLTSFSRNQDVACQYDFLQVDKMYYVLRITLVIMAIYYIDERDYTLVLIRTVLLDVS